MTVVKGGDNCNTPSTGGKGCTRRSTGGKGCTRRSTGGKGCTRRSTGGKGCTRRSSGGGGKHMYNGGNKHSCGTTGGGNKNMYGGKKHGCGTVGGEKHVTGGTYDMKKGGSDCHCGPKKSKKSRKKRGGAEIGEGEDEPLTPEEQEEMDKEFNIGKIKRQDGGKKRKSKRKTKRVKKVKRKTAKKSFLARLFKL